MIERFITAQPRIALCLLLRLELAKALLTRTSAGKRRGWGSGAATLDEPEPQAVAMRWLDH
jgi:hypothetical protein